MMEPYPKIYLYKRIVQAKLYMDEHFHEDINLGMIAGAAYFSNFHFIRLFRQAYDRTPHQYLIFLRIGKAKELLRAPNQSVADICFEVGFESVTSFTSLFKRATGFTPAAYRTFFYERMQTIEREPFKFIPGCFSPGKPAMA
jgi:AraC-like DNA-binding protein